MKISVITVLVVALIGLIGMGGFAKAARIGKIHTLLAFNTTDFSDMARDMEDSDRLGSENESPNLQTSQTNTGNT